MSVVHYTLPKNRFFLWLVAPKLNVPDEVQYNLVAHLFTSVGTVMLGAFSVFIFNVIAYVRNPYPLFLTILIIDFVLFVVRFSLLFLSNWLAKRGRKTPTELILALSTGWCAFVGLGNALCFIYCDDALCVLSISNMLGVAAVIVVRNHGCPRLSIIQVCVCTLPLAFVLPFSDNWIYFCLLASMPFYIIGMISAILKLHDSYLKALLSDYEHKRIASYDSLTNLKNRNGFFCELSEFLERLGQSGALALFYLDLDGFKAVNDAFGHAAGDDLLRQAADRLIAIAPMESVIARLGGDEFVILVANCTHVDALQLGQSVIAKFKRPFELGVSSDVWVGISVGIALTKTPLAPDALIASADSALYRAKAGGKGRVVLAGDPVLPEQNVA